MVKIYAAKHKGEEIRLNSSSGGAFTAISDAVLERNGVVFGVGYDENMRVCHQEAYTIAERDRFRGSKYVDSYLGDTFKKIKVYLQDGLTVLFSGTPCQVSGLNAYLGKPCDNLFTIDFVCFGAGSPNVWQSYIKYLAGKYGHIEDFKFRDKSTGWNDSSQIAVASTGLKLEGTFKKPGYYLKLFLKKYIFKESCYSCKFKSTQRVGDFTLADFWGIEKSRLKDFDDNKGVSLLMVNTAKGKSLFEFFRDHLEVRESNIKEAMQKRMIKPEKKPRNRGEFWNLFNEKGLEYAYKKVFR